MPDISLDAGTSPSRGFLSELEDFGVGVLHGGLESPVNAVVQLVNHAAGVDIPELDIVDDAQANRSIGGQIGQIVGGAIDFVALSAVTGGLGSVLGLSAGATTLTGTALRMGATGAIYDGIFRPTDKNSKNFWEDRGGNALVGFGTFATMGAAAHGLNTTGLFRVPAARSFFGSLSYGGLTGAAAGAAHAELDAVVRKGQILPTYQQFSDDVTSFAAFGAAMGGVENVAMRFTLPKPVKVEGSDSSVVVKTDYSGNPVKVIQRSPDANYGDKRTSFKMTNGEWGTAWHNYVDGRPIRVADVKVSPSGEVMTENTRGLVRYYNQGRPMETNYSREAQFNAAQRAADAAAAAARITTTGGITREVNESGQLVKINLEGKPSESARFRYSDKGDFDSASFKGFTLSRWSDGKWYYFQDGTKYELKANVKISAPATSGGVERLEFLPDSGAARSLPLTAGEGEIMQALQSMSRPVLGASGRNFVSVDGQGKVSLTRAKDVLIVNGNEIPEGKSIPVQLGDSISVRRDVGDRYPEWSSFDTVLTDAITFPNQRLAPNTTFEIKWND